MDSLQKCAAYCLWSQCLDDKHMYNNYDYPLQDMDQRNIIFVEDENENEQKRRRAKEKNKRRKERQKYNKERLQREALHQERVQREAEEQQRPEKNSRKKPKIASTRGGSGRRANGRNAWNTIGGSGASGGANQEERKAAERSASHQLTRSPAVSGRYGHGTERRDVRHAHRRGSSERAAKGHPSVGPVAGGAVKRRAQGANGGVAPSDEVRAHEQATSRLAEARQLEAKNEREKQDLQKTRQELEALAETLKKKQEELDSQEEEIQLQRVLLTKMRDRFKTQSNNDA